MEGFLSSWVGADGKSPPSCSGISTTRSQAKVNSPSSSPVQHLKALGNTGSLVTVSVTQIRRSLPALLPSGHLPNLGALHPRPPQCCDAQAPSSTTKSQSKAPCGLPGFPAVSQFLLLLPISMAKYSQCEQPSAVPSDGPTLLLM